MMGQLSPPTKCCTAAGSITLVHKVWGLQELQASAQDDHHRGSGTKRTKGFKKKKKKANWSFSGKLWLCSLGCLAFKMWSQFAVFFIASITFCSCRLSPSSCGSFWAHRPFVQLTGLSTASTHSFRCYFLLPCTSLDFPYSHAPAEDASGFLSKVATAAQGSSSSPNGLSLVWKLFPPLGSCTSFQEKGYSLLRTEFKQVCIFPECKIPLG